jgi:hypothetical protein
MARDLVDHNKPVFDHVHPRIYTTAIGFVVWFAVAAWLARGTCAHVRRRIGRRYGKAYSASRR